jgi:hypothetical protein
MKPFSMRDMPKRFYKMTLDEQESYLSKYLQELHQVVDRTMKMLATVRGGFKYEPLEERPDLEYDTKTLKQGEGI